MMWVLVGIASVELVVVHFLLALWWPWLALVLSAFSLATILWLVSAIRSFRSLPVLIDGDRVILRAGRLKGVEISPTNIAGLRGRWDAAALKEPGVFNVALIAYPNVVVDLRAPVSVGRRTVRSVAHRLDDPAAFAAAIEALGPDHE
jgi:hypothetical protein